ncbi:MAG: response regulator [Spirochaetales bacterium]|jgi:signal transduction histidine kinase/CheY-like chemotaxis protein|nr:response regulator [Spirochaetales bacterium]
MQSVRRKVLLIIVSIIFVITMSSLGISLLFSQQYFMETVREGLVLISRLAERIISTEINYIMERTRVTAGLIGASSPGEIPAILGQEFVWSQYQQLTVIDLNGVVANYGEEPATDETYLSSLYFQRAFRGEAVISSTQMDIEGKLVFQVWLPAGKDYILVATIPGMLFAESISRYRIYESGSIFVVDSQGTIIAHYNSGLVTRRVNFIERAKTDPGYASAGEFFSRMIREESGIGHYSLNGVDRICAWTSIGNSDGWFLGASGPIEETSLPTSQMVLIISAMVFLALGLFTAILATNSLARPYEQIKIQNLRLAELRKEAETASESKTQFLANMSHEMRTPLNAIIGLSELALGSEDPNGNAYNSMEKIFVSGMTLLGIINDILDISKIEAGKFTLIPVEYETPSMINDTISQNILRIGSKPIQFKIQADVNLPFRLLGDELRVKQIFNNLLSNAFKYTEKGIVKWSITAEIQEKTVWITSTVEDTGMGIRQEDLPKLFSDYSQVNLKERARIEGTGLGLSITRNLAELMGGSISVQSEFGKGSAFTVRFRQDFVSDQVIGPEVSENLSTNNYTLKRRRKNEKISRAWLPYATVLMVDDVDTNLDVARGMLKPYGMTVDCVNSGQKAIDLVREEKTKYNAIFMDHMMPDLDGFETVQIIRRDIGTDYARTVPIIALTANAIQGTEDLFLKNGFQAYLTKPIDIIRLDTIINRFVRDRHMEVQLVRSNQPLPPEEEAAQAPPSIHLWDVLVEGLDIAKGLLRFDNNEATYLDILHSFYSQIKKAIEKVRNFSPDSLGEYRITVHGLKGTGYTVGADALGRLAESLEKAATNRDIATIETLNEELLSKLEGLISGLEVFLEKLMNSSSKPRRAAPDPEVLSRMLAASLSYNMKELDAAIEELEQFSYETQGELVDWLKKQVYQSELDQIVKRLSSLNLKKEESI